jgi:ATP-dependent Clp protease ATP-binding subunit ClpB
MIMAMGRRGEFGFGDGKRTGPKKQEENMKERVMAALKDHFKPEFLNRVDEIITFHPLSEENIRAIVEIQLALVAKRLEEQKITLEFTEKAKDWLGKKGYDPNLGARPLKRVIQSELLDPLALEIIAGKVKPGDTVRVDAGKSALTFAS